MHRALVGGGLDRREGRRLGRQDPGLRQRGESRAEEDHQGRCKPGAGIRAAHPDARRSAAESVLLGQIDDKPEAHWNTVDANSPRSLQCEEQDSNLHALRTLEPKRRQEPPLTANLLGKGASADVLRGSEKTHSGQDVPDASDVVTMSEVRSCARALVQRVAEGGEIPIASLREIADLVLRSELVVVTQQLLDGPPEFALRRAMVLSGLILAVAASGGRDAEQESAK